jgi:hypothetical protein
MAWGDTPASSANMAMSTTTAFDPTMSTTTTNAVQGMVPRERKGIVYDQWPFRLDIGVEYQDWILVGMSIMLVGIWCLPCVCGRLKNPVSRAFTNWVYTRLHVFFCVVTYVNLFIVMMFIGILPDWSVNQYLFAVVGFNAWVLVHLKKTITSLAILFGFFMALKFRDRILNAAGMEHVKVFRFNWRDVFGFSSKRRPVEFYVWKVDGVQSSAGKVLKANDIFVECHMGDNEPMRTRVHNNAGSGCFIRESFQMNIDEDLNSIMTLRVMDQALIASTEIAKLVLSSREIFGIEDQTGKRRTSFTYNNEDAFVALNLMPQGRIWIAIAPVDDMDEERAPLINEDALMNC